MNIRRFLIQRLTNNLVHELHHAGLFVLNFVNDAGLILGFEIIKIEIPPLQKLLKGICTHPVELPQGVMHPAS